MGYLVDRPAARLRGASRALGLLALGALGSAVLAGCGGAGKPVARVSIPERQLELQHGRYLPLEVSWALSEPLPEGAGSPLVFVHLTDASKAVVRTFDHPFPARWRQGETVVDRFPIYQSAIAPALPPGSYRLTMGLYDGGSKRYPLTVEGEEVDKQEYVLAEITVPEATATAPRFAFTETWLPTEPGTDRQTVARRWLSGDGDLEVGGLPAGSQLWMALRIPAADAPQRMVLEEGASAPTVVVTSDCSGFSASVTGQGLHDLLVPVNGTAPCKVHFDSNYYLLEMQSGRKLSVAIDQLGWAPGTGAASSAAMPAASPAEGAAAATPESSPATAGPAVSQ